jgi:hypothetical protein
MAAIFFESQESPGLFSSALSGIGRSGQGIAGCA